MEIKQVIQEKCTKCKACIKECPAELFTEKDGQVVFEDVNKSCIKCSHCIAVCPEEAISYFLDDFDAPYSNDKSSAADLLSIVCRRRSQRSYSDKPITEEDTAPVIEAMRYGPTGHNAQENGYIIVTNPADKDLLRNATLKSLAAFGKMAGIRYLLKPFLHEKMYKILCNPHFKDNLNKMIKRTKDGEDRIFYDAPAVVLVHGLDLGPFAATDPTIAATQGMLAANAAGLGTCWMGFTMMAAAKDKKLKKHFGIAKDRKIFAVFTLGHPAVKYKNIPIRKKADVEWRK